MNEGVKEKLIYLLKKAGQVLIVLLLLSIAVFVIAWLCRGYPLKAYSGDGGENMS